MKYLPRFKWANLTEKLAYDSAVRKKKLQQELTQVKKETNFYLDQVDKKKQITAIKRKREEKGLSVVESGGGGEPATAKQRQLAVSKTEKTIPSNLLANVFTQ